MNIKQIDSENVMNTYGRFNVELKSGKGVYAYDENGKKYIDVASGIGVNSLGYCNDGWVNAITKQANTIQHTSNLYYNEQSAMLAQKLCSLTHFKKVCYSNSGAESNECAIKVARKYGFDKYGKDRNRIVTLKNSFHGRTVTTLSATGQDVFHNFFFPFTDGFDFAQPNDINSLKNTITEKTCAVMLEVVQGESGVNVLDKQYVKELANYCKSKDILVIVDEVQTGVGRTGKLFAYQNFDIEPDLITVAKGIGAGLPMGLCMCNDLLKDVMTPSSHGSTFAGNPVVCAGANYVIDTVANKEFLDSIEEKGKYLETKLYEINGVKNVRRMGLMVGIELTKDNAKEIVGKCVENGLLIITAKDVLRMLPPLIISKTEIDEAVEILKKTIEESCK